MEFFWCHWAPEGTKRFLIEAEGDGGASWHGDRAEDRASGRAVVTRGRGRGKKALEGLSGIYGLERAGISIEDGSGGRGAGASAGNQEECEAAKGGVVDGIGTLK